MISYRIELKSLCPLCFMDMAWGWAPDSHSLNCKMGMRNQTPWGSGEKQGSMEAYGSAWRWRSWALCCAFLLLPFLLSLESQIVGNLQDLFPRRLHENLAVAVAGSAPDPLPASLWGSPGSFVAVRPLLVARHRKTNIV